MRATVRMLVVGATLIGVAAGCGGGDAGDAGGNGQPGATFARSAAVAAGDERVAHPLAAGRYRVSWTAGENCDSVTISITQEGGGYTFERKDPSLRIFNLESVPEGQFFIEQTNADCDEWSIKVDKI